MSELMRLRAAIRELFRGWPEPAIENMDGREVQEFGERYGILVPVVVAEPCGDYCNCGEYGGFPTICYRLAPEFRPSPMKVCARAGCGNTFEDSKSRGTPRKYCRSEECRKALNVERVTAWRRKSNSNKGRSGVNS